jgi:flagellar motor switch protein FliN/FliY
MSDRTPEELSALIDGVDSMPQPPVESDIRAFQDMEKVERRLEENIKDHFTEAEIDALGEIGNICMGASATTMHALLGRRVNITTPHVALFRAKNVLKSFKWPFMAISVEFTAGVIGRNLLVIRDYDAALITDLLMGGEGRIERDGVVINEIHLSAMSEVMNQMIGSAATAMANMISSDVTISPPTVQQATKDDDPACFLDVDEDTLVVKISFDMEIEGLLKSKLMQVMSLDMAKAMIKTLMPVEEPEPAVQAPEKAAPAPAPAPAPVAAPRQPRQAAAQPKPVKAVKPMTYQSFDETEAEERESDSQLSFDVINDIPLQVTIELGRTRKTMNEILSFGVGSLIVLEKMAGELVDVIVNGKRIAKGEVVVIDDNYGVRITEIVRK